MEKLKLEILGLSSSQSQTGSFALVLGEVKGSRRLPIIIGMFEAQAIAIEIEKITPNRPMTHDLFKSFANSFNYTVDEIIMIGPAASTVTPSLLTTLLIFPAASLARIDT